MTDHPVLRRRLDAIAEGRGLTALPPVDRIEAAAARLDQRAHRRRVGAGVAAAVMAVLLLAANLVEARRHIQVVAGRPLGAGGIPAETNGEYTAVGTGSDWAVWLAPDRSGLSRGCVSIQPRGAVPTEDLPNDVQGPTLSNTLCAPGENQVGYMLRLPRAGGDATSISFGFVPAEADRVLLTFQRRGPLFFRFLVPDRTVTASTYGHQLALPIVAWVGPDPEGYTLTRLRAVTASGEVVAELTFGTSG